MATDAGGGGGEGAEEIKTGEGAAGPAVTAVPAYTMTTAVMMLEKRYPVLVVFMKSSLQLYNHALPNTPFAFLRAQVLKQ